MESFKYEGIEGFPLKTEVIMEISGSKLTQTQTDIIIDTEKPKANLFKLPKDYEIIEVDVND
ncbi:MAG: hypothetical protein AAF551_15250 [Bacteroidota bacterium]